MTVRGYRAACAVLAATLSLMGVTACGGGSGSQKQDAAAAHQVVATVNGTPITRAQVNHWMATLAGRDYYAVSHRLTIPAGLVSDPPDYAGCVAKLESVAAHASETSVQLLGKCRQLYQALRIQATEYLVGALRGIGMAHELGVDVSDATATRRYQELAAREYPSQAAYHRYLASTGESVSDGVLETKLELIGTAMLKKLNNPTGHVRYALAEQRWASKVDCTAGYVVEYCKQYKGGRTYPTPPPSVLMEQTAALVTGRCINLAACREQAQK